MSLEWRHYRRILRSYDSRFTTARGCLRLLSKLIILLPQHWGIKHQIGFSLSVSKKINQTKPKKYPIQNQNNKTNTTPSHKSSNTTPQKKVIKKKKKKNLNHRKENQSPTWLIALRFFIKADWLTLPTDLHAKRERGLLQKVKTQLPLQTMLLETQNSATCICPVLLLTHHSWQAIT